MPISIRNNWLGKEILCDTMLEVMNETRVFSIHKNDDGTFGIQEECDQNYGVDITKEQLLILANELITLANRE